MMRIYGFYRIALIAGVLLASLGVCAIFAQNSPPPFELTISIVNRMGDVSDRRIFKVGDDIGIRIDLASVSDHAFLLTSSSPDCDYYVVVLKADGEPAPDTERGHEVRQMLRKNESCYGRHGAGILQPYAKAPGGDLISVNKLNDLSRPGEYTIQVERRFPRDFGAGIVKSNIINVTVTE
jgi:hypothetical protein